MALIEPIGGVEQKGHIEVCHIAKNAVIERGKARAEVAHKPVITDDCRHWEEDKDNIDRDVKIELFDENILDLGFIDDTLSKQRLNFTFIL